MATAEDINVYIKEFPEFCQNEVVPVMTGFEQERLERKRKNGVLFGVIMAVAAVATVIIVALASMGGSSFVYVILASLIPILFIYYFINKNSKDFENKVKSAVMGKLLGFFGDFCWTNDAKIKRADIVKSKLFCNFDFYNTDDNFEGSYKGQKIVITEARLAKTVKKENHSLNGETTKTSERVVIFNGLMVKILMNKPFSSQTVIVDKDTAIEKVLSGQNMLVNSLVSSIANGHLTVDAPVRNYKGDFYKRNKMESVVLEDPEFDSMFEVYSTDQVESRYLITTSFMERYKLLQKSHGMGCIRSAFIDNSVIFAIPAVLSEEDFRKLGHHSRQKVDLFKLGDLNTPMTDTAPLQSFFKQFIVALSLVDALKLDQKIGM